jgi:dephospho-CoA kinase
VTSPTVRVALTGGVASGKSTVAGLLADQGAVVVDSDLLAREVVEPGTPGLDAVVAAFGPEVLAPGGALDRAALGRLVFADEGARRRLEGLLHPLIRARAAQVDAVLVVDVPVATQVSRMVRDRGWTREDAEARVAAQASREDRRAAATYVIDNDGTYDDLRDRVTEVVSLLVPG